MSISPARAALAAHQHRIASALAACDQVRRPLFEARDRRDAARADRRTADSDLDRAQRAETDAVIAGTDSMRHAADVAKAQATADRCRRIDAALESRVTELETELGKLEATVTAVVRDGEPLAAAVHEEVAVDLLRELDARRKAAARVEASFRALSLTFQRNEQFRLLERISQKFSQVPAPDWGEHTYPDWPAFIAALSADANTPAPAVLQ